MGFIIAGLGNPGSTYVKNRHNIGFMALDFLADRHRVTWSRSKGDGLVCQVRIFNEKVWLIKPETFMNRSGITIAGIARYYDIDTGSLLVIHDDLDMHLGRVKLVKGGGSGGHNGIRSIVSSLGSNGFFRLKFGIGRPGQEDVHPEIPVDKYVLSDFTERERRLIEERIESTVEGIFLLVQGDEKGAQNRLNCLK